MKFLLVISSLLLIAFVRKYLAIKCVDDQGNPVDWYFMYKLPRIKHEPRLLKGGLAYMYITAAGPKEWQLSNISILDTSSMLGLTLQPLLKGDQDLYHILYNDQPPDQKSNLKKGHTKGVVMLDKNEGVWIVHSIPNFPIVGQHYYPLTGTVYGQSVLCISLNYTNLDHVGIQLQYNQPQIFSQNLPSALQGSLPNLYNAAQGSSIQQSPWYNLLNVTTIGGTTFTSFAKTRQFGKELYADLIAPFLNTNLFVESWLHGGTKLPSSCQYVHKVQNVQSINITDFYLIFNSTDDHSKWAVSDDMNNWICVGDINRETTQKRRGGGSLCLNNKDMKMSYQHIIKKFENCKN